MTSRTLHPALRTLGAVLLLALAACEDDPTGPDSYVQVAGGATWVAVAEPPGMPRAETWAPYVPAASPAALELRAMRENAGRLRSA
ncbi:MAG TPA: hypothetical protein VFQ45_21335, partial [Longimicrobium sp.]|nr:hypothetical protein [Longimicrobium sp.]